MVFCKLIFFFEGDFVAEMIKIKLKNANSAFQVIQIQTPFSISIVLRWVSKPYQSGHLFRLLAYFYILP